MKHIKYEHWLLYAQDELDEQTREEYENHLYDCDHCLELYLEAVEQTELQMPECLQSSSFTNSVMDQIIGTESIQKDRQLDKVKKKKSTTKETMTHYILAAAMTLLLMSSGVFSQLLDVASKFEDSKTKQTESFVLTFLSNNGSITDKIEGNFKEGDRNE